MKQEKSKPKPKKNHYCFFLILGSLQAQYNLESPKNNDDLGTFYYNCAMEKPQ